VLRVNKTSVRNILRSEHTNRRW